MIVSFKVHSFLLLKMREEEDARCTFVSAFCLEGRRGGVKTGA
jgi:hypothetical protein